jgi:L-lactate dehydrogenase complex protein LldF
VGELPQWEELRQIGSDIRQHTIENMDVYLAQLEEAVLSAGGHVHWAETAEDARRIVLHIAKKIMSGQSLNQNPWRPRKSI